MSDEAKCPHCNAPLNPDAQFCSQCGTSLSEESLTKELVTQSIPDVLKQYDAIAQFLEGIAGGLFVFYGGVIFAGKVVTAFTLNAIIYTLPLILLLITMATAVSVLYPGGYLKHRYEELIVIKDKRLLYLWIISGITGLVFALAVFVYLTRGSGT